MMSENSQTKLLQGGDLATPLHLQQLERALDVRPFLSFVETLLNKPKQTSDDDNSSECDSPEDISVSEKRAGCRIVNGIKTSKEERRSDKMRNYNFESITPERQWLKDLLLSDTSSSDGSDSSEITDYDIQVALKSHIVDKKYRERYFAKPENCQYMFYGSGVLSNFDPFPEHQKKIVGNKRKKKFKRDSKSKKTKKIKKEKNEFGDNQDHDIFDDLDFEENLLNLKDEDDPDGNFDLSSSYTKSSKSKKKAQQAKNPEVMAMRRRKIWAMMSKKELGKVQRAKMNNHKEVLTSCKRVAQYCMKHWRQKAMQSQKNMKETLWRQKRLTREMQSYWKRYDRVERETRKRQEKEAEEQRKLDGELMEAKRQQRKLNFLITQTELYAHFMSKKLGGANHQEHLRILSQLEEEKNPRLAAVDDYDGESVKSRAKKNVEDALRAEQSRTRQFAHGVLDDFRLTETSVAADEERPQPAIFTGCLKHYQLKGMNWLANLYDQGINGILADEMGLGKTVQSIAFLCHIAEKYDAWGPFLIISPASTLHNWQQEMARFVPSFKVVPYWGSPQERKILRQFWEQKDMHTRDASFHVVITSYQLVITDFKYFNRIRWQYLILDEAQALKSTNSVRWKLLLGFNCRNRLLLSGTPIQNSMAELWALLHFIMPTLFDSHDEFNEWFSKDIESHAENKTGIDEKHLSRLHMILKPFMLRRIKKDVENELSDKIEIMVYCPLTMRQKLLYSALKKKIRIEDLLYSYSNNQTSQSVTSSLMNLVMQFRKVCNHPELFERREAKSPLYQRCQDYVLPKLVYEDGLLDTATPSRRRILLDALNIFATEYVQRSLFPSDRLEPSGSGCFSFARFCHLSPQDLHEIALGGLLSIWHHVALSERSDRRLHHRAAWHGEDLSSDWPTRHLLRVAPLASPVCPWLVFTSRTQDAFYTFAPHTHHHIPETMEHRILRSRKEAPWPSPVKLSPHSKLQGLRSPKETDSPLALPPQLKHPILPEFPHVARPPHVHECQPTVLPPFLYAASPRIQCRSPGVYCSSRAAAWARLRHEACGGLAGLETVWYGSPKAAIEYAARHRRFFPEPPGGIEAATPRLGWHNIIVPDKQTLVTDAGKLYVLDALLKKLKEQGHRVLIYSQMTKMIDLLEEYMWHRKHTCIRLDGSSKISERRDMVADFQSRDDIFVFLLSTRAGGLGINLTAADTVIFYDSDWNPTVDQQAMDRAHRLGQTKQVTVYRLICKGSIEERILQRAREKSEIQRMVISGGHFKPDTLKPKEVVSLLLDDEEIEKKYRQKQAEKRIQEVTGVDANKDKDRERKRKQIFGSPGGKGETGAKRARPDQDDTPLNSAPASPSLSEMSQGSGAPPPDETSNEGLVVDDDQPPPQGFSSSFANNMLVTGRPRPTGRGGKRGRPRGSRRGGCNVRGRGAGMSLTVNMTNVDLGIGSPTAPAEPTSQPARRGPGRPRLRPPGPGHQGSRGPSRARRPARPLPVPLARSTPAAPSPENATFGFYTQNTGND